MSRRVAMLHYAGPPQVGGVESVIAAQARVLAQQGYAVRIIAGSGSAIEGSIETCVDPMFGSSHPSVLACKADLDRGQLTSAYTSLRDQIIVRLRDALDNCEVCIAHNVTTMNKNLALTDALARLHAQGCFRLIAYVHDLAGANAQYVHELHSGEPWELLTRPWPGACHVTVSDMRRHEMAALLKLQREDIHLIPPGVDPARIWRWTASTARAIERLGLLDADGLLLLPARMTRRKNIELALRVLAHMRTLSDEDWRLMVTGPPGPHNPANMGYYGDLIRLRSDLNLEQAAHFLYEQENPPLIPDDDMMADLYLFADALLFPSTQEGFGIPVLEAGLARLPVFCADITPLRTTGQNDAVYFDPVTSTPDAIAGQILARLRQDQAYRLRHRVRRHHRYDQIVRDHLLPLLEAPI